MKDVENIETIQITLPESGHYTPTFYWSYTSTEDVVTDIRGDVVKECLINGRPYYCGCGRRFYKASLEALLAKVNVTR